MKTNIENEKDCILEELEMAKEALFNSRTIKEIKFWQQKIDYLNGLLDKKLKYKKGK
jgi:uncharacterized protein YqgV (UPF0045/DUF77 family)